MLYVYLSYAVVVTIFVLLTWYSIRRVFSVPHPYGEARAVTVVFLALTALVLFWSLYLIFVIDLSLFLYK